MKEYVFHSFRMGDVEDPELYSAPPILAWQKTEQGQWVMEHCPDPQYRFCADPHTFGHRCELFGPLNEKNAVLFLLKWDHAKA
jgi:hypothetical protein